MSLFICPICGKQNSIRLYDPTEFDLDITAIQKVGLGRGKGFKVIDTFSILAKGDPTVEMIKDRILLLSKALLDNDCLSRRDVLSALQIRVVPPRVLKARNQVIEDLTTENISLKSQLDKAKNNSRRSDELSSDLSEEIIRLKKRINELLELLTDKDAIIEDLSQETIVLTEDRNHRLQQARELREIVRTRGEKIESLEAQVEDLSEELIG